MPEENVLVVSGSIKASSRMIHDVRKLFPVQAVRYAGLTMVKLRGLCLVAIAREDAFRLRIFSQCSHGRSLAVDSDVRAFKAQIETLRVGHRYDAIGYDRFMEEMQALAMEWKETYARRDEQFIFASGPGWTGTVTWTA